MTKMRKAGFATATAGATLATIVLPSAFAGTGGTDNAGILYGQDAAYCDAQGGAIAKNDSGSGQPLSGATFTLANPTTVVSAPIRVAADGTLGVKVYDTAPTQATIAADRVIWQEAFDTRLSTDFTASDYGAAWLAASVQTIEATEPGAGSDTDPTTYTPSETVTFPADITGIAGNPSAQSAALTQWPNLNGAGVTSVSTFFTNLKDRLDAEGAVVLGDAYDETNPVAATVGGTVEELRGTDSEAAAVAEYNKAVAEFNRLRAALDAAGYDNVTWNASNVVSFGTVNTASQDWDAFVTAYDAMTAKGAYPFGLVPPTYDVIYNVVGVDGVDAAQAVADSAVGATTLASGTSVTDTTGTDGKLYYAVFGRTTTESGATMDNTCNHLALTVTETVAPAGYEIDNPDGVTVQPAAGEDAINTNVWTDTLITDTPDPDEPTPPQFESGL